jgi:hypothetical protein
MKSGLLAYSAHSLRTKPWDITRDLVAGVSSADRNEPIRASVATESFKLVRTRISIGWLFMFNARIPQTSCNSLLFSAMVFLPLYIDNDVGGDAHFM